jgi:hypothetical protein
MLRLVSLGIVSALALLARSHQLDMTAGYNYQNSDQGQGVRTSLHGWFADFQYDLTEHLAVTAEVDGYYGHSQGESLRQQNFVVGPQFTFRNEEARLRPFMYVQSGVQRSSSAATITHSFNLQMRGGLEIKLQDRLHFQITPAEYNFALVSGAPAHSYGVKTALIWTLWKEK